MDFYIIIPAHNEEAYIGKMLQSIVEQSILPKKVVVVNDASTDDTQKIVDQFIKQYPFIHSVFHNSKALHEPGSKVVNAFYKGFKTLDSHFDIICKFDADLIFPKDYLEKIACIFQKDKSIGMAGGFCYIEKHGKWVLENLTNKDHIRGALKAYRKECFNQIGGLRHTMGWDTVDELLTQYHGWRIETDPLLHVKHLKPTGKVYTRAAKLKQGEAFYKMRYGFWLTFIASAKLASKKNSFSFFINTIKGFFQAKRENQEYMVSEKEGKFIRDLRWKNILKKIGVR
ncbi:glycosyltransferase [Aequorivita xiaoshiensis]|uniref:Glycosyltransferase family 2 protein n=1 Tax=Aequorivita xiaoshiensis TaxID=2874476 RepID=A0A9X1R0Z2_9FLAO|nr:glycosyltransferase family 2 protein [Aequorivita xiaoshiensis]MCG2429563.1 glycosyltransferase family 2 protein [Aequorivita xiaoshiensis]